MKASIQVFFHDPFTTTNNMETYLPRFSSNSEADASELLENFGSYVSSVLHGQLCY